MFTASNDQYVMNLQNFRQFKVLVNLNVKAQLMS